MALSRKEACLLNSGMYLLKIKISKWLQDIKIIKTIIFIKLLSLLKELYIFNKSKLYILKI